MAKKNGFASEKPIHHLVIIPYSPSITTNMVLIKILAK